MEAITVDITEVMDTTHMGATTVVIGMAGITMATTTTAAITRTTPLSSADCRSLSPSLSSPVFESKE